MKNIKIIMLLFLLFGFASAFAQQSGSGAQKSEPAAAAQTLNKVERSAGENPMIKSGGENATPLAGAQKTVQPETPVSNPELNAGTVPHEKRGLNKTPQTPQRVEYTGPSAGNVPGGVKPEIK